MLIFSPEDFMACRVCTVIRFTSLETDIRRGLEAKIRKIKPYNIASSNLPFTKFDISTTVINISNDKGSAQCLYFCGPMRKMLFLFGMIGLFAMSACDSDFDLTSDWKDITVVYGLLNAVDSVHYVKVSKTFLCECNAEDIAQIADSTIYSDNVTVRLERYDENGNFAQTYFLEKVDGDSLGIVKEEGTFASEPNFLYRFKAILNNDRNVNDNYKLIVDNETTGKVVEANTPLVKEAELDRIDNANVGIVDLDFGKETENMPIQWKAAGNGKVYDVVIRTWYKEWNVADESNKTLKYADWLAVSAHDIDQVTAEGGQNVKIQVRREEYFFAVRAAMTADQDIQRQLTNYPIEIIFTAGGEELHNYVRASRAQTGIASLQALPEYTNIDEGLGIFSSRYLHSEDSLTVSARTKDSLACGRITKDLNFANRSGTFICQ